jgi:hypothetical protein
MMNKTFQALMLRLLNSILLLTICICLLAGCSKDNGNGPSSEKYYIRATLNGQKMEYTGNAEGRVENRFFRGTAFQSPAANFPSFDFDIDGTAIEVKTYTENSTSLIFRHNISGTQIFTSGAGNESDFTIILTEITSAHVKGTFSGTLRKATDVNESVRISDGEFFLQRQP